MANPPPRRGDAGLPALPPSLDPRGAGRRGHPVRGAGTPVRSGQPPRGTRSVTPGSRAAAPASPPPPASPLARPQTSPADAWSATTRSTATATRAGPARPAAAGRPGPVGPAPAAERGLPAWAALLLLVGVAGVGGLIDTISGAQVRGGFNIGIIVAAVLAILAVRRSDMFPIVIAPPLVYAGASAVMLYLRSGGLHDRQVLFDGAANWLVYGFPAIAAATAAVLVIAGIRLVSRR